MTALNLLLRARGGSLTGILSLTALNLWLLETGATDPRWMAVQVVVTLAAMAVIVWEVKRR